MTSELISRLEAATGPDRELDGLIWAANGGGVSLLPVLRGDNIAAISPDCPHYTASIDAEAATPALALCIAALKARP